VGVGVVGVGGVSVAGEGVVGVGVVGVGVVGVGVVGGGVSVISGGVGDRDPDIRRCTVCGRAGVTWLTAVDVTAY
jgi:hypothetical protein